MANDLTQAEATTSWVIFAAGDTVGNDCQPHRAMPRPRYRAAVADVPVSDLLVCPGCQAALASSGEEVRCVGCGQRFARHDTWIDFLGELGVVGLDIETDYDWAYRHDPRITPLTLTRWELLAAAHAGAILDGTRPAVVSVGGGGENWLAPYLDGRVASYVVVEPSEAQLRQTRLPRGGDTALARGAAERLPIGHMAVDVVEMHSVIDHFDDPVASLLEAHRVLRRGGRVTITVGNDGSWYRKLAGRVGLSTHDDHAHAGHFDVAAIEQLLVATGFLVDRSTTLGYLRLPAQAERLAGRLPDRCRQRLVVTSDALARRVFGSHRGGMMLVVATRP